MLYKKEVLPKIAQELPKLVEHKNFVKNGEFFLNQIRSILKEFDVISSEVKLDRNYLRGRDGGNMQELFFIIYTNYINLYHFIKNISFLYNSKRKNNSLKALNKIKSKVKEELNKINSYKIALNLRKKGLSAYKIAKRLNIKEYHIKNWIYFNKKPRLYSFVNTNNFYQYKQRY